MSEHLPECPRDDSLYIEQRSSCICDRLRAAEQRVLYNLTPYDVRVMEVASRKEWEVHIFDCGYTAGIKKAREAVAALPCRGLSELGMRGDALVAINALVKP